jgi:uncharacterized protein (TIGR01777 family)
MNRPSKAPRRIAIAGASGFIGSALTRHLESLGHAVVRIGRQEDTRHGHIRWDPAAGVMDAAGLAGVRIVINLAGEDIGRRWTPDRRERIIQSRVQATQLLARTCATLDPPPKALVNMSAVGYYGDRGDEELDEESSGGTGFLADVVRVWEAAADPARAAGIRVVHPRMGIVLHPAGGVLSRLLPVFRLGAGGRIGTGQQWMSWIGRTDAMRGLAWAALHDSLSGAIILTSPTPVRNEAFTAALARAVRRPALAPVPEFAIRFMFGEMGEETLLGGQRAVPRALLDSGFEFEHPTLEDALAHELNAV